MIGLAITGFFMLAGAGGPSAVPDTLARASPIEMPTNEAQHRPLDGDELRVLLRDAYATPVRPPGLVGHPPGEIFRNNGDYEWRTIRRTRLHGTYSIEGNAVCVEGPSFRRRCRRVLAAPEGVYVLVDTENGSSTTMTITPLEGSPAGIRPRENAPLPLQSPPALETLARLSGEEIGAAFEGRLLTYDPVAYGPRPRAGRVSEIYFHGGKAQRAVGYDRTEGSWTVREDRLCITLEGRSEECRFVHRGRDGKRFMVRDGDDARTPYPISWWETAPADGPAEARDEQVRILVGDATLLRLSGPDVLALVREQTFTAQSLNGARTQDQPETFGPDDRYIMLADRVRVRGRYFVEGDRLCTTGLRGGAPRCRRFYVGRNGGPYYQDWLGRIDNSLQITSLAK